MTRTITVRGSVDAPDVRNLLTAQGSVSAPSLVVPAGKTKVKQILACFTHDGAADDGSAVAFIRLGGSAVMNGEQTIVIGAAGNQTVQSGSDAAPAVMPAFILDNVDIDVRPTDTISIAGEYGGVDIGDGELIVTLVYGE